MLINPSYCISPAGTAAAGVIRKPQQQLLSASRRRYCAGRMVATHTSRRASVGKGKGGRKAQRGSSNDTEDDAESSDFSDFLEFLASKRPGSSVLRALKAAEVLAASRTIQLFQEGPKLEVCMGASDVTQRVVDAFKERFVQLRSCGVQVDPLLDEAFASGIRQRHEHDVTRPVRLPGGPKHMDGATSITSMGACLPTFHFNLDVLCNTGSTRVLP